MTALQQSYQLDLFEDNDEVSFLRRKVAILENSQESLRKSIFARNGELKTDFKFLEELVLDFHHRLSTLEEKN